MISVVIPVHNRIDELKRAIESVLNQRFTDFEVIVVDDFSEENIEKVLNEFHDNRIRFFRLDKKGNGSVARNVGIKEARGEYIAMLDSDDEWLPEHLQLRYDYLQDNNVDGVFGSVIIDNGTNTRRVISRPFLRNEKMGDYLLSDGFAPTPTHFYKTECVKEVLWDENLKRSQDLDFSIRFSQRFRFESVSYCTCVVHWKKGERRNEDLSSNIAFIEKHKEQVSISNYHKYHRDIYLKIARRKEVDKSMKRYFLRKSTDYITFCSFNDYITVKGLEKSKVHRLFLRIIYTFKVIFSKR